LVHDSNYIHIGFIEYRKMKNDEIMIAVLVDLRPLYLAGDIVQIKRMKFEILYHSSSMI